ncbi:hypothetical protein N836_35480 [Leptolyngbya sp. Heron Island J]|nr:hypothetical protein N836_35480 [Leptolyngbya sp. Heron Island J]
MTWHDPVKLISLSWLLGLALLSPIAAESQVSTMETLLAPLDDGGYQLCTEPAPQDWHDGSGACLNILKQGTTLEGYYGYPHSGSFICLRGQLSENWLEGQGLVISWAGNAWQDIPQETFIWDHPEERLSLSQGKLVRSEGVAEEQVRWIIFQTARLNMQSMYLYDRPRMTSPMQLCDWSLE